MTQDTTTTSGAADRAIEGCPELNMGNYDEVDVERLNDWAIRANDEIDRLHALAAGQATAAWRAPERRQKSAPCGANAGFFGLLECVGEREICLLSPRPLSAAINNA